MQHLTKVISVVLLTLSIFACSESPDKVTNSRFEKKEGHSIGRTATGFNLHLTGVTTFLPSTYVFYDTIFAYNGGVLNLKEGSNAYIHADRYIPKMTNGGKATINVGGTSGWPMLTIARVPDLGNTDVNVVNGTFRHDYLYSSNANATIRTGIRLAPNVIAGGRHECQGEGMIWGSGNYYVVGQTIFSKSPESSVYPYIRMNGGNFWFDGSSTGCPDLYVEDLITNANSVPKGKGTITVHHVAHLNQPLSAYSTIEHCIAAFGPAGANVGSSVADCVLGCN